MRRLVLGLIIGLLIAVLIPLGLLAWSSKPRPLYFDGIDPELPRDVQERPPRGDLIDDR